MRVRASFTLPRVRRHRGGAGFKRLDAAKRMVWPELAVSTAQTDETVQWATMLVRHGTFRADLYWQLGIHLVLRAWTTTAAPTAQILRGT
jgi:hypothetical protein